MGIVELWLPIVVAAVVMFLASFVIWAVLKYHNADYKQLADEEAARAGLKGNSPGYYLLPFALDPKDCEKPEVKQKYEEGPIAYITMQPNGMPSMGPMMVKMVIYFLVVAILCGYMVSSTLPPEAEYLAVFRVAGTVCFIANSLAVVPESIWFGRPWSMTIKNFLDALIYAVLAGGIFGWLA